MQKKNVVESSTAACLSAIALGNKLNGTKRMCLDYRKVNKQLTTDIYPLPKLDEIVETVAGNKYYACLGMKDAYHQELWDETSTDLTILSEGISLYSFKHLPFGLSY